MTKPKLTPVGPAQVTDIVKGLRFAASSGSNRLQQTDAIDKAVAFLESAAIGAGGQAVGDGAEEQEIDRLRLQAFKTNTNDDKAAYYLAVSKWFQDRHYRALSQPHPADERVVEALREAEETLQLVEHPACPDPVHHDEVRRLGRRIGFGALMSTASAAWREELAARGDLIGSEFVAGPCHLTVVNALSVIRSALSAKKDR